LNLSENVRRYLGCFLVATALIGFLVRLSPNTPKAWGAFHITGVLIGVLLGLGLRITVLRSPTAESEADEAESCQISKSE